jgi:multicomponent Na+:H+ antiporter subunit D
MTDAVVAPMAVALSTAVLALLTRRSLRIQLWLSIAGVVGYAIAVGNLIRLVFPQGRLTYQVGAWPAPFGITLVADPLSVFMLGLAAAVAVPVLVYSIRTVDTYGQRLSYHPLFHFLLLGVSGSILTGDVFNLFVWFEVMLMASYVLVVFYGGPAQTRAAFDYLVVNLFGSAVMLLAIGGLYATTGTLNMADMTRRLAHPDAWNIAPAPVLGLAGLLLAVFALKAGVVPFHFWVPGAYRAAPAPVTAMLAGVTKKVGVYAMIRLGFTVFGPAALDLGFGLRDSSLAYLGPVLLLGAGASILLGGIIAVSRDHLDDLLAYSSISQVGFILLPLGVGAVVPSIRPLAIAAALVYALNHALAKASLFLLSGSLEGGYGSADLSELSGLTTTAPITASAFLVGGFSLIGIPPLAGFFGKLLVFDTAIQGDHVLGLGLALAGALLTITYITRAWNRGFWGEPPQTVESGRIDRIELGVIVTMALGILLVGLAFDPVFEGAMEAGRSAVNARGYVEAVLGPDAWSVAPSTGGGGG